MAFEETMILTTLTGNKVFIDSEMASKITDLVLDNNQEWAIFKNEDKSIKLLVRICNIESISKIQKHD